MSIEKLPVPEFKLLTADVGSEFQQKMNAAMLGVRNAIIAFNAQIDANETSTDRVSQMNSLIQQVELDSNNAIVQVLTSTEPEVEVEFGGQTQMVVPYGYLKYQVDGAIGSAAAYAENAETAAQSVIAAGRIYGSVSEGYSDPAIGVGKYFWVTSEADFSVLELWIKGSTEAEYTGKFSVSKKYVDKSGTEIFRSDQIVFALVGDDNSRCWLEVNAFGNPTEESANRIYQALPKLINDLPQPDLNRQGFAIVGDDNSRCWLEADWQGKPTEYAIKMIASLLPQAAAGFYVDLKNNEKRICSGPNIVAWGDSMTAGATSNGFPYTLYLQQMLISAGKPNLVVNLGVGGETSVTISARANAHPFIALVIGGVIPASGQVGIKLLPINGVIPKPLMQGSTSYSCTFAGIKCTFGRTQVDGIYNYWLQRQTPGVAITVNRPEPIYLDIGEMSRGDIPIIWIGTNNGSNMWVDGVSDNAKNNERAIQDAKAMIEHLTALDKRFLVISKPSGTNSSDIDDARWFAEFGQRFIPIRQYMTTPIYSADGVTIVSCYGLEDAGITATSQDLTQIAQGQIPQSLRNDSVHWTAAGYEVLAKVVYRKLNQLGWI